MIRNSSFKKNIKTIFVGILVMSLALFTAFQTDKRETQAQQAQTQVRVTCAPDKDQALRNTPVKFTATVQNATSTIVYSWRGVNITSRNSSEITVQYGSLGTKKATTTVVTGGKTYQAGCSVDIVPTLPATNNTNGNQQSGGNQNPLQGIQNMLGGQQGGNTPTGGNTSTNGGGTTGGTQTGGTQTTGGSTQTSGNTTGGNTTSGSGNNSPTGGNQQNGSNSQTGGNQQNGGNQQSNKPSNNNQNAQNQCETSDQAEDVKKSVQEQTQEALNAEQQQMVPVNPIPIVDPILNIQENIKLLTAKEIGTNDGSSAEALDKKAACKIDEMLIKSLEKSVNFIYKADQDNPVWTVSPLQTLGKQSDAAKANFIMALQNNKNSCTPEEDKNIARALLLTQQTILNQSSQSCSLQPSEDKYDLTKLENFLAQANPETSAAFRFILATEEMHRTIGGQTATNAYEIHMNDGFKQALNKDKEIELNSNIYRPQTTEYLNAALNRYLNLDEVGEGENEALKKLLEKVIQTPSNSSGGISQDLS